MYIIIHVELKFPSLLRCVWGRGLGLGEGRWLETRGTEVVLLTSREKKLYEWEVSGLPTLCINHCTSVYMYM